jgi:hypothetical protein
MNNNTIIIEKKQVNYLYVIQPNNLSKKMFPAYYIKWGKKEEEKKSNAYLYSQCYFLQL